MSQQIRGPAGHAERIPIETFTGLPDAVTATLGSWLIFLPGQIAAWSHYQLSVINLRPIPGVAPAIKNYPEAEYEMLMVALNPEVNPNINNLETFQILTPANWVNQFRSVTDDHAVLVLEGMVDLLVKGDLPAELQGWRGAKELWDRRLLQVLEESKKGGPV